MHERNEVEKRLRGEAERISGEYQGAPVVIVVGGSGKAGLGRTMIGSSLHNQGNRLRDLLGLLEVAAQIESRKHFTRKRYTQEDFIEDVFRIAEEMGYKIETTRGKDYLQIDFGNKKLHSEHIKELFPEALQSDVSIPRLIESVAPGRPCTHRPFREIVERIREERGI